MKKRSFIGADYYKIVLMASLEVDFCGLKRYFRMIYMNSSTNCYKWIGPCKDLNIVASKCPSMVIQSYSIPSLD